MTQPCLNARSARTNHSNAIDSTRVIDRNTVEAAVYERVQSGCGQTAAERWDLNNRQFKLDNDGKLQVLSRYSTGDLWEDAEKAGANGKQRFAVELCTFRDGKVFDKAGKEVALNKPLSEESFKDSDLAMAWGADKGDRQGRRLIIKRDPVDDRAARYLADPEPATLSPSAADAFPAFGSPDTQKSPSDRLAPYEEPASPSDRPVPKLVATRTQLREWTATVDRCGRTCISTHERFHAIANDGGRLVTLDAAGENPKPLDLKRHGISHLRMHEGRFYNAESGAEVSLNHKIDPAQLEGRAFFEFRGVGHDTNHYFITEGLPPGQAVEQKQVVKTECLRDSSGGFHQERVYSVTRGIVPEDTVQKKYELSADGAQLSGFEAVKDGETHPEHGTLRFVFKPEGKDQIRVYEKRGYEESSWTFLQRDDQVKTGLDCHGCHYKTATTNWVKNDQMSVKSEVVPYDEYSPPAIDPSFRRPTLNFDPSTEPEINLDSGDPFSRSSSSRSPIRSADIIRAERAQLATLTLPMNGARPKVA